jgi:hypothetical protein
METMIRRGLLTLGLALVACGDDDDGGTGPTVDDVAGSYSATAFTIDDGDGPLDLLALGASVTATLDADGTTSGQLFIPLAGPGGSDLDEDLAGSWTLSGTTVTYIPSSSTVLTDVDFAVGSNTLTGEGTYQGSLLRLVLTKDE